MAYCKKCGAYIPIGETVCPACGYDPEAEARAEREAEERAKREAAQKAEQARAAQEREEEERARREEEDRRQQSYGGAAAQSRQTPGQQGQTWVPPWSQTGGRTGPDRDADMRRRARESVKNQKLSVLSYLGFLLFIPMILRRDDPFARYHTNQGLVLLIFSAISNLFGGILWAAAIGFEIYCVIKGISNVLRGRMEPLPLIGSIRLIK